MGAEPSEKFYVWPIRKGLKHIRFVASEWTQHIGLGSDAIRIQYPLEMDARVVKPTQ